MALVMALGTAAARAAGGTEVYGTYSIANVTDLGTEMRVTLRIRLTNNTKVGLSVTRVGLRMLGAGHPQSDVAASLPLAPRETASLDQDFTLSREAYSRWRKNTVIPLAVTYDSGGGRAITRTIALAAEEKAE
jgi:hypothetical protein